MIRRKIVFIGCYGLELKERENIRLLMRNYHTTGTVSPIIIHPSTGHPNINFFRNTMPMYN